MNGKDILCAISETDPDLINESAQFGKIRTAIKAERKKQRNRLAAGGVALALCLCAVGIAKHVADRSAARVLTAEADIKNGSDVKKGTDAEKDPDVQNETDTAGSSAIQSTASGTVLGTVSGTENAELPDDSLSEWLNRSDVVWGTVNYKSIGIADTVALGTKKISDQLYSLMKGRSQDTVYAVMVDFSSCIIDSEIGQLQCDGKTIAELQKELKELTKPSDGAQSYTITDAEGNQTVGYFVPPENEKKVAGIVKKINAARNEFIEKKYNSFRDSFNQHGLEIYAGSEGNMVFYTFATKAQLENFSCKASEAFVFLPAYELK